MTCESLSFILFNITTNHNDHKSRLTNLSFALLIWWQIIYDKKFSFLLYLVKKETFGRKHFCLERLRWKGGGGFSDQLCQPISYSIIGKTFLTLPLQLHLKVEGWITKRTILAFITHWWYHCRFLFLFPSTFLTLDIYFCVSVHEWGRTFVRNTFSCQKLIIVTSPLSFGMYWSNFHFNFHICYLFFSRVWLMADVLNTIFLHQF